MMKRLLLLCGYLMMLSTYLQAQDLQIEFEKLERDLIARTHERLDLNDVPCAVVRVSVSNSKEFTFSGNIIGDVVYQPGEAIVYMTNKSRKIRINSEKFGSVEYVFPERLQKSVTYQLALKVVVPEAKKTRTLVMPVVGLGEVTSYGIMLGIVKKWGGYIKVKHSFSGQSTSLTCDEQGVIEGTNDKVWLTGESGNSRFALTAGALYRISLPLYIYGGVGFGSKKLAWEMPDNQWMEVSDCSTEGAEVEAGAIWRIKNCAISAGVQTNQFKYCEMTLGVALMF